MMKMVKNFHSIVVNATTLFSKRVQVLTTTVNDRPDLNPFHYFTVFSGTKLTQATIVRVLDIFIYFTTALKLII